VRPVQAGNGAGLAETVRAEADGGNAERRPTQLIVCEAVKLGKFEVLSR